MGRLDILVSNAGIIRVGPVQSTSFADYEPALAAMAVAPVRLTLAALAVMQAQGTASSGALSQGGARLGVELGEVVAEAVRGAGVSTSRGCHGERAGEEHSVADRR
jgi:NAD(P)-dependent dehydrogenase (short-subunit alcohol dehydrogenase family)